MSRADFIRDMRAFFIGPRRRWVAVPSSSIAEIYAAHGIAGSASLAVNAPAQSLKRQPGLQAVESDFLDELVKFAYAARAFHGKDDATVVRVVISYPLTDPAEGDHSFKQTIHLSREGRVSLGKKIARRFRRLFGVHAGEAVVLRSGGQP